MFTSTSNHKGNHMGYLQRDRGSYAKARRFWSGEFQEKTKGDPLLEEKKATSRRKNTRTLLAGGNDIREGSQLHEKGNITLKGNQKRKKPKKKEAANDTLSKKKPEKRAVLGGGKRAKKAKKKKKKQTTGHRKTTPQITERKKKPFPSGRSFAKKRQKELGEKKNEKKEIPQQERRSR